MLRPAPPQVQTSQQLRLLLHTVLQLVSSVPFAGVNPWGLVTACQLLCLLPCLPWMCSSW